MFFSSSNNSEESISPTMSSSSLLLLGDSSPQQQNYQNLNSQQINNINIQQRCYLQQNNNIFGSIITNSSSSSPSSPPQFSLENDPPLNNINNNNNISRTNTPSTIVFEECNCSVCCWGNPLPPLILNNNNILNGNNINGINCENGINTHSPSFSSLLLLSPGNINNSRLTNNNETENNYFGQIHTNISNGNSNNNIYGTQHSGYYQHYHNHQNPLHTQQQQQPIITTTTNNTNTPLLQSSHNFTIRKNGINQRKPQIISPDISVIEEEDNQQIINGEQNNNNRQQIIIINENSENEGKRGKNNTNNKEVSNGEQQINQNNIARAPPETLEWIKANYEFVEGASLPRNILYTHYSGHCRETGLTPVNAASFGKLIRLVFDKKLSTRRLGTRGHSKYHYNGICLKQNSPLRAEMHPSDLERMLNGSQQPYKNNSQRSQRKQLNNSQKQKRGEGGKKGDNNNNNLTNFSSSAATSPCEERESNIIEFEQYQENGGEQQNSPIIYSSNCHSNNNNLLSSSTFLLPPQINDLIEIKEGGLKLPEIELPILDEGILLGYGLSLGHALKFFDDYREHCREVLNCIKDFRLQSVERLWLSFWQKSYFSDSNSEQHQLRGRHINEDNNIEIGQMRGAPILDNNSLYHLCSLPEIQTFVQTFDIQFYQIILDFFFISPLRIPLESDLCNSLRHFGKNIEFWMENSLGNNLIIPPIFKKIKLECIRLLANSLTRLSSFAHLAITARSVLQDKEKVKNLHDDFNRVDFGVFHWQADWLCSGSSQKNSLQPSNNLNDNFCNYNNLAKDLVYQFREHLSRHCSLEEWADWLESIVDKALNFPKTFNYSIQQISNRGKRFILSWNLHSSLLLKEITLHSSTSFGEFHLVRLVFDDYLLIVMERKLAKILGKLPIELMAPEWLQMETNKLPKTEQSTSSINYSSQILNHSPTTNSSLISLIPSDTKMDIKNISKQTNHNFYSTNIQQNQKQINSSSHYLMIEKLPLPGPEPPLDMLNGNNEGDYQEEEKIKQIIINSSQAITPPQIQKITKENNNKTINSTKISNNYILIEEQQKEKLNDDIEMEEENNNNNYEKEENEEGFVIINNKEKFKN